MSKHEQDELNTNIRQALDESVESLDANTLSKIRQIRAQAIDRVVDKADAPHVNWLGVMSGGLATACVMVFVVMVLLNTSVSMQTVPVDDLELISSSDNLELFEDLEFYEWLDDDALFG